MDTTRPQLSARRSPRQRISQLGGALRALPARRTPGRLSPQDLRLIADLRSVIPSLPARLEPRDVVGACELVLRRAAEHEFAREGLDLVDALVDLPPAWGRRDLLVADIPSLPSYQAFVLTAAAAPSLREIAGGGASARSQLDSPSARDEYGITLEAAGELVSFLLSRGWDLFGSDLEFAPLEQTDAETDTGTDAGRWNRAELRAREIIAQTLQRVVTIPQALRAAQQEQVRVQARGLNGADEPGESPARGAAADPDADLFAQGGPAGGADGEERAAAGAAGAAGEEDPEDPRSFAQRAAAAAGRGATYLEHARTLRDLMQTDAGRTALKVAREGGTIARDVYAASRGGPADGANSRKAGGSRTGRGTGS